MKKKDILTGVVILAALAVLIFYWQQPSRDDEMVVPQTLSVKDRIEEVFSLKVPDDVEKVELEDKTEQGMVGLAMRKYEDEKYTLTILADLVDPEGTEKYQGWLKKEDEVRYAGSFILAKGGYILDYEVFENLNDYPGVVVSLDEKVGDSPGNVILEGSF